MFLLLPLDWPAAELYSDQPYTMLSSHRSVSYSYLDNDTRDDEGRGNHLRSSHAAYLSEMIALSSLRLPVSSVRPRMYNPVIDLALQPSLQERAPPSL